MREVLAELRAFSGLAGAGIDTEEAVSSEPRRLQPAFLFPDECVSRVWLMIDCHRRSAKEELFLIGPVQRNPVQVLQEPVGDASWLPAVDNGLNDTWRQIA